ncbi:fas1 domain-containing protein [Morchella snyderi]|nr:fas1 domain-containing protein [Morchella snyderi]
MKLSLALLPVIYSLASAQLLYPLDSNKGASQNKMPSPNTDQTPLQSHEILYSSDKPTGSLLLSDKLSQDRSIDIFAELTRKFESISTRLSNTDENTTVLAPSNVAVSKLPRKPWEDPNDEEAGGNILSDIYKGLVGEDRASRNERNFVEAHLIGVSPWPKGEKIKTLQGKEIWWDMDGKDRIIYPDGIKLAAHRDIKTVPNGEIWILDGVINY